MICSQADRRFVKPSRRPADAKQRAFTLIEILLALGLSVVLLAAMYTALDFYRQFSSAGRVDIERSQLARAILRKMELDIRSLVYRKQDSDSSAGQGSTGSDEDEDDEENENDSDNEDSITIEVVDPVEAYSKNNTGIYGNLQTLVMHVNDPPRLSSMSSVAEGYAYGGRLSDLRSVAYFLAVPGSGGLQGLVGELAGGAGTDESTNSGVQGLARFEGDRLSMTLANEQANLESMAGQTKLLAKEINFLQYRYFDGTQWLESWDSVAVSGLPLAIEITIGFRPAAEQSSNAIGDGDSKTSTDVYRLVVSLPLSEPYQLKSDF